MLRVLFRTFVAMAGALLLSLVVAGAIVEPEHKAQVEDILPKMLSGTSAYLTAELQRVPQNERVGRLAKLARGFDYPLAIVARDQLAPDVAESLRRGQHRASLAGASPILYAPIGKSDQALAMGPVPDFPGPQSVHMGVVVLTTIGILGVSGLVVVLPMGRRLFRLGRAADRVANGERGVRVAPGSRDMIGRLADQFNAMATRIESLLDRQRSLLEAVAHELRHPIARVRLGVELMATGKQPAQREQRRVALECDLDELTALVDELLEYQRLDSPVRPPQLESVDVGTETKSLWADHTSPRSSVILRLELGEGAASVSADRRQFRRAVRNLLDNARRHATTEVVVATCADDRMVEVRVADDGPGIPAEARDGVFEPFARLAISRSRSTGGAGLGLAIVRRVLQRHGGSATVTRALGGGAEFVTQWPKTGK